MTVSRAKGRVVEIDARKVSRGVFLTRGDSWLTPEVRSFIVSAAPRAVLDPFAGEGHMLEAVGKIVAAPQLAYDIDPSFGWPVNDSLKAIPPVEGGLIVTNPPYLAKHSARRKGVRDRVDAYYGRRDDLYQVALDRCLEAAPGVVAIVPETLLNSDYPKEHLRSVTVLEENPFSDTDCPVCVVCLERRGRPPDEVGIYRAGRRVGTLADVERMRLRPRGTPRIVFNVRTGPIALRAVDLTRPQDAIRFMRRAECDYPAERIVVSSRLVTFIEVPGLPEALVPRVVEKANAILADFRAASGDLTLSPFKGNTTEGRRRRRLDYRTARAILELSLPPRSVLPTERPLAAAATEEVESGEW